MRFSCLHIFLFLSVFSNAQPNFEQQIKDVMADSASGFRKFRDRFKTEKMSFDSTFLSTIQIEGTRRNEIYKLDAQMWVYSTIISDSVKLNEAKKIADEWKNKVEKAIGPLSSAVSYKIVAYNPSAYGWRFNCDGLTIAIDVFSISKNRNLSFVTMEFFPINKSAINSGIKD